LNAIGILIFGMHFSGLTKFGTHLIFECTKVMGSNTTHIPTHNITYKLYDITEAIHLHKNIILNIISIV